MKQQSQRLESLTNIGRLTARKLQTIGILTVDDFLARDPYEVFEELRAFVDPSMCRCALACLVGAHHSIVWHKIRKEATAEYEKRYPKLKGKC
ncbi:MAG: TfoX/Sxy family DNA transformation protein [Candidatus Babeliaceae bacterium]|nr:TfoX/Sxy family DNA transformation protein [Candidatus Babeliaceae bacterium]